jgi:hypothetical protein
LTHSAEEGAAVSYTFTTPESDPVDKCFPVEEVAKEVTLNAPSSTILSMQRR